MSKKLYGLIIVAVISGLVIGSILTDFFYSNNAKKAREIYFMAQALIREGKEDEGAELLKKLILNFPETETADNANKMLNDMTASMKKKAQELYSEVQSLLESDNLFKAKQLVLEIIEKYPKAKIVSDAERLNSNLDETTLFDGSARFVLRNVATAQEAYYVDHQKYTRTIDNLRPYGLDLPPDEGVTIVILDASETNFDIYTSHKKGSHAYRISGPSGRVQEGELELMPLDKDAIPAPRKRGYDLIPFDEYLKKDQKTEVPLRPIPSEQEN